MTPVVKLTAVPVVVLLLAILYATAVLTNSEPSSAFGPLVGSSTNPVNIEPLLAFGPPVYASTNAWPAPLRSAPGVYARRNPEAPQPLKPGAYQTHPDAIILIVPELGLDDRSVTGGTNFGPRTPIPIIKPQLRAEPLAPSK